MKICINSSTGSKLIKTYNIEVFYAVNFDTSIYAAIDSDIKPIKLPNGHKDQQALANYESFADNIYALLCEFFEIIDVDFSDKSDTSRYFYMFAKNPDGDIATKFVIRLRLSDHEYTERHSTAAERKYVENHVQEMKQPKSKKYQKWRLENIVVNNETFSSYFEAEDAIENEIELLGKQMYNKGN